MLPQSLELKFHNKLQFFDTMSHLELKLKKYAFLI